MHPFDHNYSGIAKRFNLPRVECLGKLNNAMFIFGLINGELNRDILNDLNVRTTSYSLSSTRHLSEFVYPTNTLFYCMIPKIIRL